MPLTIMVLRQGSTQKAAKAAGLAGNYTDIAYDVSRIPFGQHSHYIQVWRGYMETVPASTFVDSPGMNFNLAGNPQQLDLIMRMLASHGIKHARIEVGWGSVDYHDETKLINATTFQAQLLAAKKNGVRPLVLLNAHHGKPCPTLNFSKTFPNGAKTGDTSVTVNDTSGIIPGYTGINGLTPSGVAAETLITAVNGNIITLSKPIPRVFNPGETVKMTTLKYRPFSVAGSADYNKTMSGWIKYVDTVARFAAATLGTTNSADKGFDMEVWNELTFGTRFLNISKYYTNFPSPVDGTVQSQGPNSLVGRTAEYATKTPALFSGVQFSNGFAATIPWPSSPGLPVRFSALSKHPYSGRLNFPADERQGGNLNALGQKDPYVPTYSTIMPEHFGNLIQTETLLRDAAPNTNYIQKNPKGRYARVVNGQVLPVNVWITEVNIGPAGAIKGISKEEALALKAKSTARYLAFYVHKGVKQLHFYAASGSDIGLAMVQENFLNYAKTPGSTYPVDDSSYTSPALKVIERMTNKMKEQMDPSLTLATTRPLTVMSVTDTHNNFQFTGDGTAAHPTLYNREVLAILPFQVNSKRFVIPYYVMTRDYTKSLPPEQYNVVLQGIKGNVAQVSTYDPIKDQSVPVSITARGANTISLTLTTVDYPYMLTIDEGGPVVPTTAAPSRTPTSLPAPTFVCGGSGAGGLECPPTSTPPPAPTPDQIELSPTIAPTPQPTLTPLPPTGGGGNSNSSLIAQLLKIIQQLLNLLLSLF